MQDADRLVADANWSANHAVRLDQSFAVSNCQGAVVLDIASQHGFAFAEHRC